MYILNISTLTVGQEHIIPIPSVSLKIDQPNITLEQLIKDTVRQQFQVMSKEINQREITNRFDQQYLSVSDIEELAVTGKISFNSTGSERTLLEDAIGKALNGFKKRRFKVFVGSTEVQNLDACIALDATNEIKFLRLMPLMGG